MKDLTELFSEFGTTVICVSDLGIITNGTRVDYIQLTDAKDVKIWAGNPEGDKYAEELCLPKYERRRIFEEIIEAF